MPDAIDATSVGALVRVAIQREFRDIGIFADDDESLRATRLNFEWLDRQRRGDPDLQELLVWLRSEKERREDELRRAADNRAEVRRALLGKGAEWLWHIVSAAIAGTVTYIFTTRGHG
ncbi:hypothetical protein [Acidisoma sp. 7E03]